MSDAIQERNSTRPPVAVDDRVLRLARTCWDYLRLGEPLVPGDAIFVFGSADFRTAEWGARLLLEGKAPLLVLSGGRGPLTRHWPRSEAELFADRAAELGVPRDRMLLETDSTNTGENVRFTRRLLEERGLDPARWILVHTPYLERRTRATFRHYWPGKAHVVTSPPIPMDRFATEDVSVERLVHRLAGEVHRIVEYPGRGWQARDEVPEEVLAAWRELVDRGFVRSLV